MQEQFIRRRNTDPWPTWCYIYPSSRSGIWHARLFPTWGEVKERKSRRRFARKMLEQGSDKTSYNAVGI
ncbi:hypothetical protein N7447_006051 [Penicillium robsamsonii]|uniref:uncharacterized protein n=1 Tax=Penicillium robsamsonii TaxID=1792511 RepID=UPI00254800EC|nr:uncharacterized protein N7447_006051 [Penicillium robsamsonii]KAJ5823711.1 hypothetical protein N7447_006051 [Penicillium robsamsonii]